MSILCGTDFSDNARGAADVAAALAERLNEPLVLLHSVEAFADTQAPGDGRTLREESRELLAREAERVRLAAGPRGLHAAAGGQGLPPSPARAVLEKVAVGPPDEALADYALQPDVKLVVVSSLGRRLPLRWLLGSVAERTAQTSPAPVLVVRDCGPWLEWLRGERPLRVVVGADPTPASDAALRWVAELSRAGKCAVTVAYAAWPPEEHQRLGLTGSMDLVRIDPDAERVLLRDLTARAGRLLGQDQPRVRVLASFGRPADRLLQLARDEQADVLAVGTHQRHGLSRLWHGSVSRELLHHAPMSVACIPVPGKERRQGEPVEVVRRVLAATDLSEPGNRAVAHAYSVLPDGGVVHLVHVAEPGGLEAAGLTARLEDLVPENAEARHVETHAEVIRGDDVASAICAHAERLGVDLICLGTHGRSGLAKALVGSVAQGVMLRSIRPLLLVRHSAE